MDIDKRIILLGSGIEIDYLLRTLCNEVSVVAYGAEDRDSEQARQTVAFCKENEIDLINNHKEVDAYNPDFIFMISYSKLISIDYIEKFNFINLHAALLPEYRGIHGGTWAIINGEKNHGFTIHKVDEGIDSGPIYYQLKIESGDDDTVNTIRQRIFNEFKKVCRDVYIKLVKEEIEPIKQDELQAKYVCKRTEKDSLIDWAAESEQVFNLIRALTPPYTLGAYTYYKGSKLYVLSSIKVNTPPYIGICGQVVAKKKNEGVFVKCGDNTLLIKDISIDGRVLNSYDFFRTVGARLGVD